MKIKNYFNDWTSLDWCWAIIATIAVTVASLLMWDSENTFLSWIILIGTIAGMWDVILVAKCKIISNFITGLINCVCFGVYYLSVNLLGNALLNLLFFLPLSFLMLYVWLKNKHKTKPDSVPTRLLSIKGYIIYGIIITIATIGFGYVLSIVTPDTFILGEFISGINPSPYLDAFTLIANIIAFILMIYLYTEQWWLWLVVDLGTLLLWIVVSLRDNSSWAMVVLYACWLTNAVYGTWQWLKNKDQEHFKKKV